MKKQRVFLFVYSRRGQSKQWDAVSPAECIAWDPEDQWADREVRVEQDGKTVLIKVYSEEAIEENDTVPAEELADNKLRELFPGHVIIYPPDPEPQIGEIR
jgi:hypothetical protein